MRLMQSVAGRRYNAEEVILQRCVIVSSMAGEMKSTTHCDSCCGLDVSVLEICVSAYFTL